MRSRMHPKYYLSPEIFQREQEKIFRKLWLFAGLKTLLPKNNSFITRKIAGIPVVIQNFNGTIHAFENVCLHRSARIQTEAAGCRPLVCPYHAWSYGEHGEVKNIPHCDAIYGLDETEKKNLKLREFALRAVGNLLFINLDANPLPIEEQFPPGLLASLQESSDAYDGEVMVTTWHGRFNWKLAYENLRDFNHVRYVHPRSLVPAFEPDFDLQSASVLAQETLSPLPDTSPAALRKEMRRFSTWGADGDLKRAPRFPWHDLVERWGERDAYFNWLVFPNLHIACADGGFSFTLEHHIPVAPGRTDLEIYRLTARKKQPYAYSHQVLLSHMHSSKLVVGEDVAVMESVQSALHADAPTPTQGAYESLNRLVERWYATLMENEHGI